MLYLKFLQSLIQQSYAAGTGPKMAKKESKQSNNSRLKKMKAIQEKFQQKDGKPIFLKMGFRDQLLYRSTVLLALVGLFESCRTIYTMIYPAKPEEPQEEQEVSAEE